jgi:hypothetical protein
LGKTLNICKKKMKGFSLYMRVKWIVHLKISVRKIFNIHNIALFFNLNFFCLYFGWLIFLIVFTIAHYFLLFYSFLNSKW